MSSWFAQIQFYSVQFDLIQLNAVHHRTLFSPLSQSIMMSYINSISFDEYRLNFIISQITCPDKQSVNPHSSTSHSDTVSVEGLFSPMPSPSLDISRFRWMLFPILFSWLLWWQTSTSNSFEYWAQSELSSLVQLVVIVDVDACRMQENSLY